MGGSNWDLAVSQCALSKLGHRLAEGQIISGKHTKIGAGGFHLVKISQVAAFDRYWLILRKLCRFDPGVNFNGTAQGNLKLKNILEEGKGNRLC